MRMTPWTVLVCTLTVLVVGFLAYRMVRPMNIFVVSEAFERPIAETVPSGLTSLSARACGGCHAEIYREWSESMHAQVWMDPYFQVISHSTARSRFVSTAIPRWTRSNRHSC